MKSLIALLFCIVMFFQLNAQNSRQCYSSIYYVIEINKIHFIAKNPKYNPSNLKNLIFCDNCVNIHNIEGLKIKSNELFLGINLENEDIATIRQEFDYLSPCYSYDNRNNDSLACISTLYLDMKLKIPIILNGVKLQQVEIGGILSKICETQIIEIKRKENFWGKARLEITTR